MSLKLACKKISNMRDYSIIAMILHDLRLKSWMPILII